MANGVSQVTERLRVEVLGVLRRGDACHAGLILAECRKRDFRDSDFGPTGLYRAVDRALQYHRKRGSIYFVQGAGWCLR